VAALAFGFLTLLWPGLSIGVLVLLWGFYALFDGVALLTAVLMRAPGTQAHRGFLTIEGLAGVAAGVVTLVWPGITALVLLYVIAAWAAIIGATEVAAAVRRRAGIGHHWLLGLGGVLLIAFAVSLVVAPVAGALAITWLIGWWAIVFGAISLAAAGEMHKGTGRVERGAGRATA
jgi:uncharacterized membrane protein HdeD (DUF308 family)